MTVILDHNPANGLFHLQVPRTEKLTPLVLMNEYGFNFSQAASTAQRAVMFTSDPYAAASFSDFATAGARDKLGWIVREIEASRAEDSNRHIDCPADKELWPFQRADVDYLMRREHGLDGDEPGLGKTPTAICVANEMQAQRVVVVCPASIRYQWCRRVKEWTTLRDPFVYPVVASRYGINENAEWTIISYELARRPAILRALVKNEYDLLIVDEAHYAKDTGAKRTRAIFGYHDGRADDGESDEVVTACLAERSKRILCLSGTPLPNRPREAYVMARALDFAAVDYASQTAFNERYNPVQKRETAKGKVYTDEREGREAELQNRLRAHFMCRHLKRSVMKQLKMPVYDLVQLEETRAIKQALAAERLLDIDPELLAGADMDILGQVATVRRMMGVAMAPQVADYLDMLVDGGETKLVVFAWHIEVLDILCRALEKHGVVRVDGSDGALSKDRKTQRFINDPSVTFIIGNLLSLGTGTDGLQLVSNHALIAEPDWTPGNNVQAFDRLDRGGQLRAVQGDIMVAPGSIAEKILAAALRKMTILHKALDKTVYG